MAPRVDLAPCVPGELIQSNQTFVEEQRVARPLREEDLLAPSRGFLDDVRVFKRGDVYIGRGSKQRGLGSSIWGNPFKVKEHGLQEAVRLFRVHLANDAKLKSEVPKLAGKRLLCHCKLGDACHGDVLIECFIQLHPRAYVVGVTAEPPSEAVALAAARAREECEPDTDTDFDEDAAPPGSGWRGRGEPLWTGRAGKARELQDGAGLCSPGRWRVEDRRYPSSNIWTTISNAVWECAVAWGKPELFEALSRGEVAAIPFASSEVLRLRGYIVDLLKNSGHLSEDQPGDRQHATPRWRLFGAMLAAAQDPDAAGIREFVRGVPIGVGVKLPRLPALYKRKTRWSLEA